MEDNAKERCTLDETPVASLNKDFHQLLEEKLEQYGDGDNNHDAFEDKHKQKRKFLKKGEGLARFRMKPTLTHSQQASNGKGNVKRTLITNQPNISATKLGNPGGKSKKSASSSVTGTNRSNMKEKDSKNCIRNNKTEFSKASKSQYPRSAVPKLTLKSRHPSPSVATWADILQQQNQLNPKVHSQTGDSEVQQRMDFPQNSPEKDSIEVSFLEKVNDTENKNKVSEWDVLTRLCNVKYCNNQIQNYGNSVLYYSRKVIQWKKKKKKNRVSVES